MKLKKLEINGFKSFPEKAVIHFPEGISSIVGPNGCGKSNIIDALKWVMGEQSASQLRGKSMDDVIFSGTDKSAQLNMAEVSLTLANDNGSAPQELSHLTEIMITRRLYRSGERAYFLNKQPCRLKDIYNIFLGSGMGARSYSIIQQGNIGAITEATPEERRTFIEEAAGVTRYKTRKIETLRKIKSTNQDLLRIKDIMAEVQQRLNSLNRQAKKARRYRKYQAAAKELDIFLALFRHEQYTTAVKETETLLESLKDIDQEHITRIGKLDAAIQEIKLAKETKERELAEQKEAKHELQRRIDKTENDLDYFRKDKQRLDAETEQLQQGKEQLLEKIERLKTEIQEAEARDSRLRQENQKNREELARRQQESASIKEQRDELNQRLENNKNALLRLAADEAKYHNICENAADNKETLKKRQQEITKDRIEAAKTATRLKTRRDRKTEEWEQMTEQLHSLEQRIAETQKKLENKQKALTDCIKAVHALEIERNKIKSRYSEIKRMAENFEWYKDGVRAIMKSEGADKPTGVLGITADVVQPEPGLETATEAVLGETLQYIMVDNHDSGASFIQHLRARQAGRSGFIPVSLFTVPGQNPESATSKPAIAENGHRRLIDHLSIKEEFRPVLETLIGAVVLADDLPQAMQVWRQSNGSGKKTVVTPEGDLITASGMIIGGSADRLSGILSKKQELLEMKSEIARLDQQLETARKEQKNLETDTRELETDLQKIKNDKNQKHNQKLELEKELYTITEDRKHAEKRLEILELEEQHLAGEESELDDEINKYSTALAEIQEKTRQAEKQIEEINAAAEQVLNELEEFNQLTVDLQLQLNTSRAELENNSKTLERLRTFQSEAHRQLEQLLADIASKEKKAAAAGESISRCEQTLADDYIRFTRMEEALAENESTYQTIHQEMAASDEQFSAIRSRQEENAEKMRYLEREQADRKMNRDNIEGRLEERYHQSFATIQSEYAATLSETEKTPEQMEEELTGLREKIHRIGEVNLGAIEEYQEQEKRLEFLTTQHDDLVEAIDDLHAVMKKINRITQERFIDTFTRINEKMAEVFPRLFDGGTAELVLTEPDKPLETGVELMVHPPGKKLTRLSLLSGGEKALSAIAFVFSIFLLNPTSFCLMDEIDAPLDEANIYRFNELLKIIGEKSQIIMITHNKRTMEFADKLLGVTMEKKGVSTIVSVDFDCRNGSSEPVLQTALAN